MSAQVMQVLNEQQNGYSTNSTSFSEGEEQVVAREPKNIDDHAMIKQLLDKREIWNSMRYGNHKVYCGGKIIIGPVKILWWLLELVAILTGISFLAEYTIFYNNDYHLITIIGGVLFMILMVSSFLTLCCDPGIVTRPSFEEALENAREAIRMNSNGFPTKRIEFDGRIEIYRYCTKCHCFRAPKTRHCGICDCCVENFDHHCPVFGGCIGKNNLQWFKIMVASIILYFVYMLINSVVVFTKRMANVKKTEATEKSVFSACITFNILVIGLVICAVLTPIVTCLTQEQPQEPIIRPYAILPDTLFIRNKIYPLNFTENNALISGSGDCQYLIN